MRGLKSTLALLVILIGVVAYIYFVDSKKPAGDAEVKEKAFAEVKADDVEELQIKSAEGETTRLQKTDGKWRIVEPVKADADNTEVSNIATSLSSVDIQRVVDEKPSATKEYGLDPARIEVGFRLKGKQGMQRLLLGDKTPAGGDLYARLPDRNRVFLVNSFLDSTFNKNTLALRDKAVLKFERDKADSLELVSTDRTLEFAKSGTDWKIVRPVAARGDFAAIEGAIERLASLQMQNIKAESASDLAPYGLDKPTATISVGLGSSKATLILGRTEDAVVYAKDASRPLIFTVAPTVSTDLFKDVSDYRRKDLFDARAFTADQVSLVRGAETITLTRSKGKDGKEIWKNASGRDVDAMKVDDLLSKVTALRADKFSDQADAALKMPVLTVTTKFDSSRTETVTFARAGTGVAASRADEPGSATLEGPAMFDEVMKAVDAVK